MSESKPAPEGSNMDTYDGSKKRATIRPGCVLFDPFGARFVIVVSPGSFVTRGYSNLPPSGTGRTRSMKPGIRRLWPRIDLLNPSHFFYKGLS